MLNRKILWLDLETSSLSPKRGKIIQIAAVSVLDGKELAHFSFYIKHEDYGPDWNQAFQSHKITKEKLASIGQPSAKVHAAFTHWLDKHFAKELEYEHMKIILAGKSIQFDKWFLISWLSKDVFDRYFHYHQIDLTSIAFFAQEIGAIPEGGASLSTLVKHLNTKGANIDLTNAHEANADIRATIAVYYYLVRMARL